jgi:sucrose-6-phosphate hydrolase SacC (GH32 family)
MINGWQRVVCAAIVQAMAMGAGIVRGADDVLVGDFEGETYAPWEATGEAFGAGPARGTLPNQQAVAGFVGRGLVNSYVRGDGTVGRLTSPAFEIERPYVSFLIGGGRHEGKACVNLVVDGKVVRTATGANDERLDWESWDVRDLRGRTARVEIVDEVRGGWGHVNVDQVVQSEARRSPVVDVSTLYGETYRPQFHFTAEKNWLNDPNGLVYFGGEYHLFFQHNPSGIEWGNMTWGHAVSTDLVRWRQLENALLPDAMGTMYSGSAVVDHGNTSGFGKGSEPPLVILYTAAGGESAESKGRPYTQCVAYSNDRGRTWTKYAGNPVLGEVAKGNRDPKVVWHGPTKRWVMALYKSGNDFALYASPDLKAWTHLQDLTMPGCDECPDFFEVPVEGKAGETRWVFVAANGRYWVGAFDGRRFTPESGPHPSDHGGNYYAVQSWSDVPEGRRIQLAWMRGGRYPRMPFNQQMSFPCEVTLRETAGGPRLFRRPVEEVKTLREGTGRWNFELTPGGADPLAGVRGDLFDIVAEIEPGEAEEVSLVVRGEAITYTAGDRTLTCLGKSVVLPEGRDGRVTLRVLVDRASIEVFADDGGVVMSSCFVPATDARSVEMRAKGGAARVRSLEVHTLRSAWAGREGATSK